MRHSAAIEQQLRSLAAKHPDQARLVDIGDSARKVRGEGGHDVLALVLGEHADDPAVPRVLLTAGLHGRETANQPLLAEWARRTLDSAAAGDAARGALLRERTVVIVPNVNPDALDTVIAGLDAGDQDRIWRRTNDGAHGGVDLNRNFDNRWNGGGAEDPGSKNWRGPFPASEPEVQAIQQLARSLGPKAVYDVHSPGEVVLVPTGAPDAHAAAQLVARATGYAVSTSDEHWSKPVGGGTVKDWAHDQLGAVSLTIETGTVHHQDDAQYAETTRRMLPAIDALVATVDGHHAPPAGAEALLR
jgi:predicted deacylase